MDQNVVLLHQAFFFLNLIHSMCPKVLKSSIWSALVPGLQCYSIYSFLLGVLEVHLELSLGYRSLGNS